jgi:radical SAM/Cys-rich protein
MRNTRSLLLDTDFPSIARESLNTLQVNLGYLCNQRCLHCHVNAGPTRTEIMNRDNIDLVLAVLTSRSIGCLDLTGGAPEMNPDFRYLVTAARKNNIEVIDRCNLTILQEPGYEGLAEFLASQQVVICASLPCYVKENVDQQRGDGVYQSSIAALQKLNSLGYGQGGDLRLDLVYNPQGPVLPPPQQNLESAYKKELMDRCAVSFDNLLTITNMPINRFGSTLVSRGQFHDYMQLLRNSYRQENLQTVMCRTLISVDWQGYLYDCDFNQMLDMPLLASDRPRSHLSDLLNVDLEGNTVSIAQHCYACTAGQGSSCGGALVAN